MALANCFYVVFTAQINHLGVKALFGYFCNIKLVSAIRVSNAARQR